MICWKMWERGWGAELSVRVMFSSSQALEFGRGVLEILGVEFEDVGLIRGSPGLLLRRMDWEMVKKALSPWMEMRVTGMVTWR